MAEQVDLAVPITRPSTTNFKLERLNLDFLTGAIHIQLLGPNGEALSAVYDANTNPTGASLITALNTANLTSNSLAKRIYTRLIADGYLAGTVSGTPQ
jgi:hypothetical protein